MSNHFDHNFEYVALEAMWSDAAQVAEEDDIAGTYSVLEKVIAFGAFPCFLLGEDLELPI